MTRTISLPGDLLKKGEESLSTQLSEQFAGPEYLFRMWNPKRTIGFETRVLPGMPFPRVADIPEI